MLKIRGTQIRQEISALNRRAMGPYARPFVPEALHDGYAAPPIGPAGANSAAAQYFNTREHAPVFGVFEIHGQPLQSQDHLGDDVLLDFIGAAEDRQLSVV
ncbi:hypothetical protein LLE87_29295, partial [Paenibacillus polymyxa]|nr:hypothetical protein [Paenibacillus polymyxa]